MISNPNHVFYACIAKGPTVVVEFSQGKESGIEIIGPFCFQGELRCMFREILALDADLVNNLMEESSKDGRNPSLDSTNGKGAVIRPLIPKPTKVLMMKKKKPSGEATGDHHGGDLDNNYYKENGDGGHGNREVSVSIIQKSSGFFMGDGKQKAKQIWKKHVWVVLALDLIVCAVLCGVWLWVCRGFKCIDG